MTSRSCWTAAFAEDSTSLKPWREVQIPLQSDAHTYLDSLLVVLMGSIKLSKFCRGMCISRWVCWGVELYLNCVSVPRTFSLKARGVNEPKMPLHRRVYSTLYALNFKYAELASHSI